MSHLTTLPDVISLGIIEQPHVRTIPPSEIRGVRDLPSRLFLGDLDLESFRKTRAGWTARYVDGDCAPEAIHSTRVELEFRKKEKRLLVAQWWRGILGSTIEISADDWNQLLSLSVDGFPRAWLEPLDRLLKDRYSVANFASDRSLWQYVFFPDGYFLSTHCIVPIDRLREAFACIRALEAEGVCAASASAHLERGYSAVNLIEGRCPDAPTDPCDAFIRAWKQTGLAPVTLPLWERPPGRPAALTVRRHHYTLVVECALRDLARVLGHLHTHDLIGGRTDDPVSVEDRAVVLPAGLRDGRELGFFDARETRRVVVMPRPWTECLDNAQGEPALESIARIEDFAEEGWRRFRELVTARASRATGATHHFKDERSPPRPHELGSGIQVEVSDPEAQEYMATEDEFAFPPEVQRDVDAVIAAFRHGREDSRAFQRLTAWLEEFGQDGSLIDYDHVVLALPPPTLRDHFADLDDETVAAELDLDEKDGITTQHRLAYFESRVLPNLYEDADVSSAFGPVPIKARDGTTVILVNDTRGYSFSGITVEWSGPYESAEAFREALVSSGWILDPDDFVALPEDEKLRRLRGETSRDA